MHAELGSKADALSDRLLFKTGMARGDRPGVTVVEIVVVIMIVAVLAAVAAPKFVDSLLHHRVESTARRVKADLQRLKQHARLTGSPQAVEFDTDELAYTISIAGFALDNTDDTYRVDLSVAPYEVHSLNVDFDESSVLEFDGHGIPVSGGHIVLTAGTHAWTIEVDGTTGQVSITHGQVP